MSDAIKSQPEDELESIVWLIIHRDESGIMLLRHRPKSNPPTKPIVAGTYADIENPSTLEQLFLNLKEQSELFSGHSSLSYYLSKSLSPEQREAILQENKRRKTDYTDEKRGGLYIFREVGIK